MVRVAMMPPYIGGGDDDAIRMGDEGDDFFPSHRTTRARGAIDKRTRSGGGARPPALPPPSIKKNSYLIGEHLPDARILRVHVNVRDFPHQVPERQYEQSHLSPQFGRHHPVRRTTSLHEVVEHSSVVTAPAPAPDGVAAARFCGGTTNYRSAKKEGGKGGKGGGGAGGE
jgi:hypothetical protein